MKRLNIDREVNIGLASVSAITTGSEAWLLKEKRRLQRRNTKTSARKIKKFVNPSLKKLNKISSRLGYVGVAYNGLSLGYDILSGEEITASRLVDTGVAALLSFVAISNPVGLIALGVYSIADSYGAFDGLKSRLGGDKVIINGY